MKKVKFVMLCGLPASGKSTYCEQYKHNEDWVVLSSDEIRAELSDINDQSQNELVFNILHIRVKEGLLNGKNVIYDATNLNRRRRIHFINHELRDIPCEKICVLFATPYEMCLKNNANRERKVPEDVIKRMVKNFEVPCKQEGWDDIQIKWADVNYQDYNIVSDLIGWKNISHNNPNHSSSIGDHMILAAHNYYCYLTDMRIYSALLMHDCGKIFCKEFIDSKGNVSEIAHYYNHENVSSYMSLFYLKDLYQNVWTDDDILEISLLINLHMRPLNAWSQSDKAKQKDMVLFGDEIIKKLEIMNRYDKEAH